MLINKEKVQAHIDRVYRFADHEMLEAFEPLSALVKEHAGNSITAAFCEKAQEFQNWVNDGMVQNNRIVIQQLEATDELGDYVKKAAANLSDIRTGGDSIVLDRIDIPPL